MGDFDAECMDMILNSIPMHPSHMLSEVILAVERQLAPVLRALERAWCNMLRINMSHERPLGGEGAFGCTIHPSASERISSITEVADHIMLIMLG